MIATDSSLQFKKSSFLITFFLIFPRHICLQGKLVLKVADKVRKYVDWSVQSQDKFDLKRLGERRRKTVTVRLRIKVTVIKETFQRGLMEDCSHSRDRKKDRQASS